MSNIWLAWSMMHNETWDSSSTHYELYTPFNMNSISAFQSFSWSRIFHFGHVSFIKTSCQNGKTLSLLLSLFWIFPLISQLKIHKEWFNIPNSNSIKFRNVILFTVNSAERISGIQNLNTNLLEISVVII